MTQRKRRCGEASGSVPQRSTRRGRTILGTVTLDYVLRKGTQSNWRGKQVRVCGLCDANRAWCTGISRVDPDFVGCRKCRLHGTPRNLMGRRPCAGPMAGPLRAKHIHAIINTQTAEEQGTKSRRNMTSAWYHVSLLCAVRSRTWHHDLSSFQFDART